MCACVRACVLCVCVRFLPPPSSLPHFICIQSMAGCGLSEDTFSAFFYNYGSSWETPSYQVRGGWGGRHRAPVAPAARSLGTRQGGRGWGTGEGWGYWGEPSGSPRLGQCQPTRGRCPPPFTPALAFQSPGSVASLPRPICRGHLPPSPPQLGGSRSKRPEPARYPEQLQAKSGNSSATFSKSPRAPRPCAPGARPPSSCAQGLRSCRSPVTCRPPPSTPPGGPRATFPPKMAADLKRRRPLTPRGGEQSGCSGAPDPAPPRAHTGILGTHTLNFDDCAMQSGSTVPSAFPAAGL